MLYFTDFATPLNNTYSLYYDLLEPYIEIIKSIWNKLVTYFNNIFNTHSTTPEMDVDINSLKNEVKVGMKEAIDEALDRAQAIADADAEAKRVLLKQIAFYSSALFFVYFIFVLPVNLSEVELNNFNFINQSLIEVKTNIVNYLNSLKPGNPGTGTSNNGINPITPVISEGGSTVTPNTPVSIQESISHYFKSTKVDASTQTNVNGINVSKMEATMIAISENFPAKTNESLVNTVNGVITKITD